MTEAKWLQRFIFLETVAALPGMVGGAIRHLHSLRLMKRDNGWIHTLLEEAENERMHLLTFIQMRQPGPLFRGAVLVAQGVVFNLFFISYLLSPKTCHRFVGYLEEEAVKTYTHAIADLDAGRLPAWNNLQAPPLAVEYWKLKPGANMRDLLLAVRADEAVRGFLQQHAESPLTRASPDFALCKM
jgi:threonyl-tRNA synthetase